MNERIAVLVLATLAVAQARAEVTFERLLNAADEPENWLNYSATYDNQRYSRLDQITRGNVGELELKWIWQARSLEKFEATPLVVDGILYTVQAPNDIVALDAATGRVFWTYHHENLPEARACCGSVNRGLAILGETLFMGTLDAHLIAVDAISGQLKWKTKLADAAEFYSITMSPLVVEDRVIIGTGGGDGGARGIIAAFDAATGEELWRFLTIPGPGEPGNETWSGDSWRRGGAAVWNHAAYDPETGLAFWGTGNPAPVWDGRSRLGDNLYSDSVVALDVDTGELVWHYQFTPHDEIDYDSTQVPILTDVEWQGEERKAMLWANRNGLIYLIDRVTGEFLHGKPFVAVNWMDGFDENGRPNQILFPTPEGTLFKPHVHGATNWAPPAYSPRTGLYYVSHWEDSAIVAVEGEFPRSAGVNTRQTAMGQIDQQRFFNNEEEAHGVIRAYEPSTLDQVWEYRMADITWAGTLATAGDLVFGGGREGHFIALDAESGELLWTAPVGGQVNAGPMSFAVDGTQHIAVAAGNALFTFALP
ncbi:MAG TPA: PQQ-dependent dehydrogenase, methanol/ethanol family [Gammaproteobacteria bacterium]|nr:PQQ-dependent dehydrogenase, methanol/ethanol family [Gammaproteobacteria bacterium]